MRVVLSFVLAVGAALLLAWAPAAVAGGGRVVFPVGLGTPVDNLDAAGAHSGVALADGGVALFGDTGDGRLVVAEVDAAGMPNVAIGVAGVTTITIPGGNFSVLSALRDDDDRLLVIGTTAEGTPNEALVVVRLLADGQLDRSYGTDGIAEPGLGSGCGSCEPAALAPGGAVVLTGRTRLTPPPGFEPNMWAVARLTESGTLDPSFGAGGILAVPGVPPGGFAAGIGVAVAADGRITLLGARDNAPFVLRVLPTGAPDPSFAGGGLAEAPHLAFHLLLAPGGGVTVVSFDAIERLTSGGAPDVAFGGQGIVPLSAGAVSQPLSMPDGEVLVYRSTMSESRPSSEPAMILDRFDAAGSRTTTQVNVDFGGGEAGPTHALHRAAVPRSLRQNAFRVGQLVARPDGSFVAVGGVSVKQSAGGEGAGFSTAQFAAAGFTPAMTLDPTFGSEPPSPTASVR